MLALTTHLRLHYISVRYIHVVIQNANTTRTHKRNLNFTIAKSAQNITGHIPRTSLLINLDGFIVVGRVTQVPVIVLLSNEMQ